MTEKPVKSFRKALTSVPNLLSFLDLFTGFLSILLTSYGQYTIAGWLILLAMIWDSLDGKIARAFGEQTPLGSELDSLADVVSFVVAPAVFVAHFFLLKTSPWLLLFIFFYLTTGAYRLARYNIGPHGRGYFEGLPTPAAGVCMVMLVLAFRKEGWTDFKFCTLAVLFAMLTLSFLMVSRIRYPKLSSVPFSRWRAFLTIELIALIGVSIGLDIQSAVALVFILFVLISPAFCLPPETELLHPHEQTKPHDRP